MKQPITETALMKRINRKLVAGGTAIRKTRERWVSSLGEFYEVDIDRNVVTTQRLGYADVVRWGRELGAMKPSEYLEGLQG